MLSLSCDLSALVVLLNAHAIHKSSPVASWDSLVSTECCEFGHTSLFVYILFFAYYIGKQVMGYQMQPKRQKQKRAWNSAKMSKMKCIVYFEHSIQALKPIRAQKQKQDFEKGIIGRH